MRFHLVSALSVVATTALSGSAFAEGGDYPFLGLWDCEIAVLEFTNEIYHDGTNEYPMAEVTEADGTYIVTLTPDYVIGLSKIEPKKMRFAPLVGGDEFMCFLLE
jgi:hypothetical protein